MPLPLVETGTSEQKHTETGEIHRSGPRERPLRVQSILLTKQVWEALVALTKEVQARAQEKEEAAAVHNQQAE